MMGDLNGQEAAGKASITIAQHKPSKKVIGIKFGRDREVAIAKRDPDTLIIRFVRVDGKKRKTVTETKLALSIDAAQLLAALIREHQILIPQYENEEDVKAEFKRRNPGKRWGGPVKCSCPKRWVMKPQEYAARWVEEKG